MEQLRDIRYNGDIIESASGDMQLASYEDSIKQRILARLMTVKGSLVHRPGFGVGLKNYQNKVGSFSNIAKLATEIREQVEQDEDVQSVDSVSVIDKDGGRFDIAMKYTILGGKTFEEQFKPFGEL